ncbi:MAG: hypothetical protein U0X73_04030 [Thermoanaerobaculia bacterium]
MKRDEERFVTSLVQEFPDFRQPLEALLARNNGELLPHVFMADVARVATGWFTKGQDSDATVDSRLESLLAYLDLSFQELGPSIRNLLAASFLENLLYPSEQGGKLAERLGPALKQALSSQRPIE